MKKLLVVGIILIILGNTSAQNNWFSDNAKWYFNHQELLTFPAHGYDLYEVSGDTIINNDTAKIISQVFHRYNGDIQFVKNYILKENNSKVYFWNENKFDLMYDFSLNIGDTLNVEVQRLDCDTVTPITVESIDTIILNNTELKVMNLQWQIYYGNRLEPGFAQVIESVGFNKHFIFEPKCLIDQYMNSDDLRCYEDENILYKSDFWIISYNGGSCDSLINDATSIPKIDNQFYDIKIYPNPANENVFIESKNKIKIIIVYNFFGNKVMFKNIYRLKTSLNVSNLNSGLYLVNIYFENGKKYCTKFNIEK